MQGGMYNVLEKIIEYLEDVKRETFTTQELSEFTGFCRKSISNNLTKLVKMNFILQERFNKEKRGYYIRYKINPEIIDFIKGVLY